MKTLRLFALSSLGSLFLFANPCAAHGGRYSGPGDVVPPSGGGRGPSGPLGPTTPGGPSGPGNPAPGMPSGPGVTGGGGPAGPGGPGSIPGQTGARGGELTEDFSRWEYWWEFNKAPFLRLKDAVHEGGPQTGSAEMWLGQGLRRGTDRDTLRPTDAQVQGEVLPALKRAIDSTESRDIASSCMIAMAKIGHDHQDFRLIDVFQPRLRRADQEIRETAALAIGIAGIAGERELKLLSGLALDDATGRAASDGREVSDRTRAFATYGLGLLVHRTNNLALQEQVLTVLQRLVEDDAQAARDVRIAAVHAISLLQFDCAQPAAMALRAKALACLEQFYLRPLGATDQVAQAHCPTAIAKLVARDEAAAEPFRELFAQELAGKGPGKRTSVDIARSCAMALGRLCRPCDEAAAKSSPDAARCKLLLDIYHDHRDAQTRAFALLALGQIGGTQNRATLLVEFGKARKALDKPWVAIALGVYAFRELQAQVAAGMTPEVDATIGRTLADAFAEQKEPSLRSALAIGLGLCRWTEASDRLRDTMVQNVAKQEFAGYLCIALALMGDRRSASTIHEVVRGSSRRPELLQQAAVALGKLGDKTAAEDLLRLMGESGANLAKLAAIATALAFIGDRRSLEPLQRMLSDSDLGDLPRAFAAVALGGIADKETLPWNSKLSCDTNYRANTATLTDSQTGVLDIL